MLHPSVTKQFAECIDTFMTSTAFALLGVTEDASDLDVRRATRRLLLPARFGGAGLGSAVITRPAANVAGLESTFTTSPVQLENMDDEVSSIAHVLHNWPEFTSSLNAIATAAANTPPEGRSIPDIIEELHSLNSTPQLKKKSTNTHPLQRVLSDFLYKEEEHSIWRSEPDLLMRATQRSGWGPEPSLFLGLPLSFGPEAKLPNGPFTTAVLLRIGYPILPRTDENCCKLCNKLCGRSGAHILVCQTARAKGPRNQRHSAVQHQFTTFLSRLTSAASSKRLSFPVIPAPGRPSYSKAFRRTKDGGDVQYADVLVSIKDEDHYIDFLIAAPNDTNAKEASQQVSYVAKQGETRKHKAVLSHYDVPLHRQHQIVPFVLETSGSMGTGATKFLDRMMAVYPNSSPSSEGLLIGRLKERMAADVLKHNSYLVETYLTLCGATSGPRRGRVGRLPQSSGIETLRSIYKEAKQN